MGTPSSEAAAGALASSEAECIRLARDGDLDAFNSLVELHQRIVFNLCLRMLGSGPAAEDATQEAFLSAYRNIGKLKGETARPWLLRIAANACTDELRRRGRRPAISIDAPQPGSDDPIDLPDAAAGPEAEALRGEERARLQAALLRLPADQRIAVVLCDVQGFAYEEIAEVMRTSVGTVKSRIARGRDKLRTGLAGREPSEVVERHDQ